MDTKNAAGPLTLNLAHGRVVLAWKLVEYVGLALFVILVPRAMGPEKYGTFAALLASVALMTMASDFGGRVMLGRFVPEHRVRGEDDRIAILFTRLFLLRLGVALALATGWAVLSRWLLPGASTVVVLLGACAGVCAIAGITCFDLFYGLNVLNRWLLHRCANQIILFVLLVAVFGYDQLERAAMALLLTHFVFLVLGVVWARPFFSPRKALVGFSELLAPLRFAMALFVANLLLMAMVRGGELLVLWLTGRHADVAFYNIANAVAVAFTSLVGQLTAMLIPSLTAYHLTGEGEKNESVAGLSLKYMTIVAFCFLFGVFAAGPWVVRQVLGEQYTPVVANLKILAFGLVPAGLVNMGMLWAVIQNEAGKAVLVTGSALACFVVSSFVLVPRVGASGVCVAFVVGMSVAGLLTCRKFSLGPALVVARFGRLMAVGLASSLVLLIPSMPIVPVGLLAGTVFVVLLFATGTVSTQEIRHLVHMSLRGQA